MESVLLAIVIFLLIILILMTIPKKSTTLLSTSLPSVSSVAPSQSSSTTTTTTTAVVENKSLEKIVENVRKKGCADEKLRERLKKNIKEIITCKCAFNQEFCRHQLEQNMDTITAAEAKFINAKIETPCLDRDLIAFEEKIADLIMKSGVNVCELSSTDLRGLGRYIDDLVNKVCEKEAYIPLG